jgi:uncharacterized SAM-binding protein YcdF (DUF218 family)
VADVIVIFGAAVRADGSASGSLRRRCESAARYGKAAIGDDALRDGPFFLATGGVGRHGPAEALVMRDILVEHGIAPQRILLETEARDTLESVRLCTRLLRGRPNVERLLVASSSYHTLRCTWLFRLAGFASQALPTASDRPHWAGRSGCAMCYVLKELLAISWNAALLLAHKIRRTI